MKNKIIFFHNTAAEYRIPLFQKISDSYDVLFVFTRMSLSKKIYGNDIDNNKLKKIKYKILSSGINAYIQIYREIAQETVEGVVIPTMDTTIETVYAYWIFLLAKIKRKKTYYFWEKWEAPSNKQPLKKKIKNLIQRKVSKIIFSNVDYCFAPGKKTQEYFLENKVDREKIQIIYNTSSMQICEYDDIRSRYGIPPDSNIIMYFGRIIEKKGLSILIKAYSQLPREIANKSWLLVVGDGEYAGECKKLSNNLNVSKITWAGSVHPDKRYSYFSQCDIFVLPTYHWNGSVEAWGLTINEAIQCGKIVVGTTAVGSAFDLINSRNGYIVEENNVGNLKKALINSSLSDLKRTAYFEGLDLLKTYNYENSANQFIEVFKKLST